jgi:hypothetical protein
LELREDNSFIPHQETRNHRLKRWNDWIKVSKTKLLFLLFHSLKSFSKPFLKIFFIHYNDKTLSFTNEKTNCSFSIVSHILTLNKQKNDISISNEASGCVNIFPYLSNRKADIAIN